MRHPLITRELVLRLEAAETAYTKAKLCALGDDDLNARGVEIARSGHSTLFSIQSRRNNPSVNRVMGFVEEDLPHLEDILGWLRDRSDFFWLDLAPALVGDATLKALADAGLYPAFFLNTVYAPPRESQGTVPAAIHVDEIDLREQVDGFTKAFSEGFGIPQDLFESTKRSTLIEHSAPEWRTYLATVHGEPASMATMYIGAKSTADVECIASIDAMGTAPAFRRRGCQSALLGRCVTDAARASCTLVASQTRPSSISERNMVRAGFQIAYTKLLYAPRKPGARTTNGGGQTG